MIKLLLLVLGLVVGVSLAGYFYGTLNKDTFVLPTTTVTPTPVATGSSVLAAYQTCTNPSKKISLKYPTGWFTNKTGDPCRFFGISPTVDEKTALVTLNSSLSQKDFNDQKALLTRSDEERIVLNTSNLEVAGFNAQRIEAEATGIGASAKGAKSVFYLIENPVLPLVFSYIEVAAQPNREEYFEVMEVMVGNLVFN